MINITRRHVLRTSVLQFLSCCAFMPVFAQRAVRANGSGPLRLNWAAFVDQLESVASTQHMPAWNQIKYTEGVAALASSLNLGDKVLAVHKSGYRDLHRSRPEFQDLLKSSDVQISLISFERGEYIPHHDHPEMTGVMICAVGLVEVKEYDVAGPAFGGGLLLKPSGERNLSAGMTSTLTSRVRNVHAVRARSFSQMIDIFTPPYDEGRMRRTRWFQVEPIRTSGAQGPFVAHPIGAR